jgi:transcriptional regulator with XRE-family HTH domain
MRIFIILEGGSGMQSIYDRIEYLIKQKGITKKSFCEQLNISTGNMGDWKRGKSTPGTHKLIEIGAFFHVSLDWLILGKNTPEVLREGTENYFFEQVRQLDCQSGELLPSEKEFIKEYIAFTEYRKRKAAGEDS